MIKSFNGDNAPVAPARRTSRVDVWKLVCWVSIGGGIILRCAHLGRESLWFDEGYTAWAVSNPWRDIIRIIRVDTAPPLFYLLLRGWALLLGFSEASLRSMPAIMASVALVVFFAIARRLLLSPVAVVIAVALFAFSFMQIAYAHEARFYSMMTLMAALDLLLVLQVCDRSTPLRLSALIIAWSISLWTNNILGIYLGFLGIAWLMLPGRRTLRGRLIDASIVTIVSALIFAPWVPTMLAQTARIRQGFWPSSPDIWLLLRTTGVLMGVHEQSLLQGDWHWYIEVNLLLVLLIGLGIASNQNRQVVLALSVFSLGPILLVFLYSRIGQSIFMERAFLASGLAMPLIAALGYQSASTRQIRIVVMAFIALLFYLSLRSIPMHVQSEHGEDWRSACAFANSTSPTRRLIICTASDGEPLFRYYALARDYKMRGDVTGSPATFFLLDPPRTMQQVKSDKDLNRLREQLNSGSFADVVLISSHTWYGDHDLRTLALLQRTCVLIDSKVFTGITVFRFKRSLTPG